VGLASLTAAAAGRATGVAVFEVSSVIVSGTDLAGAALGMAGGPISAWATGSAVSGVMDTVAVAVVVAV
jgi:hypothetical protein